MYITTFSNLENVISTRCALIKDIIRDIITLKSSWVLGTVLHRLKKVMLFMPSLKKGDYDLDSVPILIISLYALSTVK